MSVDDRRDISSILSYLKQTDREKKIQKWLADEKAWEAYNLTKTMGFDYVSARREPVVNEDGRFNFSRQHFKRRALDVSRYDFVFQDLYLRNNKPRMSDTFYPHNGAEFIDVTYAVNKKVLTINIDNYLPLEVDLANFIKRSKENEQLEVYTLDTENKDLKARILIGNLYGQIKGEDIKVETISFDLMIGVK